MSQIEEGQVAPVQKCEEVVAPQQEVIAPQQEVVIPPVKVPRTEKPGRTSSKVTDPREMESIFNDYKKNGGALSFSQLEEKYNLRKANGMNAYRVVKAWKDSHKPQQPVQPQQPQVTETV